MKRCPKIHFKLGELALIRETNYERLYCKNTNNEIVPIHRIMGCGEFETPLPTMQEAWVDAGLAEWDNEAFKNLVFFIPSAISGDYTPPEVLDMNNITSMWGMFESCMGLISLYLKGFNTSNVTTMLRTFYDCSNMTSVDVSSFDTSKVTTMGYMFFNCGSLTSLDITSFNAPNLTYTYGMFKNCSGLKTIDVSKINMSKVGNMGEMFNGCSSLTSLDLTRMEHEFSYIYKWIM